MKTRAITFFLVIPILMTGCELNNVHPEGPPFNANNTLVNAVNEYLANQQRRYNCLADYRFYSFFPKEVKEDSVMVDGKCEGKRGDNSNGQVEAQAVRNETLAKGLTVIDANYQEWVNYLYLGRATGNFIADTIELTTSGVIGSLSGPANTLSALGVGLTTFRGARSSFDLNFFQKQDTTILVNQMDTNRAKVYEVILVKKEQDITKYSMQEAIKDLIGYYNAGTPISAFTALSQQTAINTRAAENRIRILQGVPISEPITDEHIGEIAEKAFEILRNLKALLKIPDQQIAAIYKLNDILSALKSDKDFQAIVTQQNLTLPTDPTKIVTFLENIRRQAALDPKYGSLVITINQTIVNFGQ